MVHEPLKPSAEPRIPGYRIESVLGRGATGTVYRARQESVDRVVALKILHPDLVGTRAERRLQREARTTARLAHPNIISAIDMGVAGGRSWYAMELVDGVNLLDRLRERPLGEREALRMFVPLCEALQHAFERGVVHRDLKPANILIERGGRALIVDLGLAAAEDDPSLTKGGGTLGTPAYISPEQARDPKSADVQSDLWSLGATLYHALCGRPPFDGDSVAEILSNVLYAKVQDPRTFAPDLSAGMVLVLRKCLTRDRAKRYATPAQLAADLERLRERRAPEIEARELDPLAGQRRIAWWMPVAVLGALAAGAAALLAFGPGRDRDRPDEQVVTNSEDALDALAAAVEGDATGLGPAWDALLRARASPLEGERAVRARDLESRLRQRLGDELDAFKRASNERFKGWLAARDYPPARAFVERNARGELAAALGGKTIPESVERELSAWTEELERRLEQHAAETSAGYSLAIDRWWTERFAPDIDAAIARGDWLGARDRLLAGRTAVLADAAVEARGVDDDVRASAEERVQLWLDQRRARLDQDWNELDRDLRQWVVTRAKDLFGRAEERALAAPAAALDADWERELAARKLDPARFPNGLSHEAAEEYVARRAELAALEERLAADDARFFLAQLGEETQPLWKARRFSEAAQRYEHFTSEGWTAPVRRELELTAREARLLDELLLVAAQGVRARDKKPIELRISSVLVSGRLEAGADPQTRAFRIVPSGSREWSLSLREVEAEAGTTTVLLGAEGIETLARAAGPLGPRLQLALGFLRSRESDPAGARAALGGELPTGEPLVAWLTERLASAGGADGPADPATRKEAKQRLRILKREAESARADVELAKRIDDFLARFGSALDVEELADARRIRERLVEPLRPVTMQSVADTFRLPVDAVRFEPNASRVTLRFSCAGRDENAFDRGAWERDGKGWTPNDSPRGDEDFLARRAPTLALGDPLRLPSGALDVLLVLEVPGGVDPELLLVSIAGFHFAMVAARDGREARILADTGEVAKVLERARAGEGRAFPGWRSGETVELHWVVRRSSREAQLELGGRRVLDARFPQPPSDAGVPSIVVRAWERIRLLSMEIEASRR